MAASVDLVIPAYNEEKQLAGSILSVRQFLQGNLPNPWRIVVADNGSTDSTAAIGALLAQRYPDVAYLRLEQKGRGRALRRAWLESEAGIVSYMDVDLSTELEAYPKLVGAIEEGCDIAIGTRLSRVSRVRRSLKRTALSRGYNWLIKGMFLTSFSDAQCGFKAISRRAARALLPLVQDQGWFFDSELLILAEKNGYRIKEIPVTWVEDADSRVNIPKTVAGDLRGLLRLRFGGVARVHHSGREGTSA